MDKENFFEVNESGINNLSELSRAGSRLCERRICEIAEIADLATDFIKEMTSEDIKPYEILSLISDSYPEIEAETHREALKENSERLAFNSRLQSIFDKLRFSELLVSLSKNKGIKFSEKDFLPEVSSDPTFVYVKNVFSDEAYDVFSQGFDDPRVRYAENFKEALNLVGMGAVTYAILPLEEKGARIASVSEMLYRYDLKINSVIPVFGFDGQADIKYALVSKSYTVPEIVNEDDRYLEIRIPQNSTPDITEILSAAAGLGIKVYRVNTQSINSDAGVSLYYSIVFCGEGVDYTALLVFLTLFAREYSAAGLYENLED